MLDQKERTRQAELRVWLVRNDLGLADFAPKLGVSISMVSKIFRGSKRTPRHIASLIRLGIPAELLPEPGCSRPGRPAKTPQERSAA